MKWKAPSWPAPSREANSCDVEKTNGCKSRTVATCLVCRRMDLCDVLGDERPVGACEMGVGADHFAGWLALALPPPSRQVEDDRYSLAPGNLLCCGMDRTDCLVLHRWIPTVLAHCSGCRGGDRYLPGIQASRSGCNCGQSAGRHWFNHSAVMRRLRRTPGPRLETSLGSGGWTCKR